MKKMITLAAIFSLGGFANAEDVAKAAPKAKAGDCAKSACNTSGNFTVKLAVTGLDKEGAAAATQKKLKTTAGVTHCGACAKSGTVMVKYVPEILDVADIEKAVAANGLKVAGHKTSMTVKGMKCQACSDELTEVLEGTEGVVIVDVACKKSGTLTVTFDPSKIDRKKIKAAVNATKYKVVDGKAKTDCKAGEKAPAPQS